jgi:signal peptidase I
MNSTGELIFPVKGTSMLPVLKMGDLVVVKQQQNYKEGDIIVFAYHEEGLIIHRIIKIYDNCYICKGDNAQRLERVNLNQIIGKMYEKKEK